MKKNRDTRISACFNLESGYEILQPLSHHQHLTLNNHKFYSSIIVLTDVSYFVCLCGIIVDD